MGQRTPLYDLHIALGAKMMDVGGWDMPLHYGSQVDEHHQVRQACGVFDVSHMTIFDVRGEQAQTFLEHLLANDIRKLTTLGQAHYSLMLNEQGGVVDDLIVYKLEQGYRLVGNAGNLEKDLAWLSLHCEAFDVAIKVRDDLAIFAIQGPNALTRCRELVNTPRSALIQKLKPFQGLSEGDWFIARTGYTGEDGLEIMLPSEQAVSFFNDLVGAGIAPIGLGARDTLRLEAGLVLYGNEINESSCPFESGLGHVLAMEGRDFIGKTALEAQKAQGAVQRLVGLVLEERGVLRAEQVVRVEGVGEGAITSGSFSPTLGKSIALARVPMATAERAEVEIRGKWYPVRVVSPKFVHAGKVLI